MCHRGHKAIVQQIINFTNISGSTGIITCHDVGKDAESRWNCHAAVHLKRDQITVMSIVGRALHSTFTCLACSRIFGCPYPISLLEIPGITVLWTLYTTRKYLVLQREGGAGACDRTASVCQSGTLPENIPSCKAPRRYALWGGADHQVRVALAAASEGLGFAAHGTCAQSDILPSRYITLLETHPIRAQQLSMTVHPLHIRKRRI